MREGGSGHQLTWPNCGPSLSWTGGCDSRSPSPTTRCIQLGRAPCRTGDQDQYQTPGRGFGGGELHAEQRPGPSMPALPSLAGRGGAAWGWHQGPGHQPVLPCGRECSPWLPLPGGPTCACSCGLGCARCWRLFASPHLPSCRCAACPVTPPRPGAWGSVLVPKHVSAGY